MEQPKENVPAKVIKKLVITKGEYWDAGQQKAGFVAHPVQKYVWPEPKEIGLVALRGRRLLLSEKEVTKKSSPQLTPR